MANKYIKSEPRSSQANIDTHYYTVGYRPNGGRPNTCPALNLNGRWLHAYGFVTGQPVTVAVKHGQIIIDAEIRV